MPETPDWLIAEQHVQRHIAKIKAEQMTSPAACRICKGTGGITTDVLKYCRSCDGTGFVSVGYNDRSMMTSEALSFARHLRMKLNLAQQRIDTLERIVRDSGGHC